MTNLQKQLKSLRARQSVERGRMSELAIADSLTDETRAEMDELETGTADLDASSQPVVHPDASLNC